jgi:outer membrane immunogenic protein
LLYVKGGLAVGEVTAQTSWNAGTSPVLDPVDLVFVGPPIPPVAGTTKVRTGWALGGGMEFALTENWSAFADYTYFNLGSNIYKIDAGDSVEADVDGHSVRVGVNYRFAH